MLALDESNDADSVFNQGPYKFCIEQELLAKVEAVTIDFTYMGFSVEPQVALGGGGGSCSTGGGGCSGCGSH